MRVGLFVPSVNPLATPEYLTAFAEAAEEGGFSSVWAGEHVVTFDTYASRYPYSPDGSLGLPAECGLLEPFTTLTWMGAASRTLRLGTAVCLLPQRHPVYTAKEVSTLDWLTAGRVSFGIGIGWLREEFEALGVPFERRADRCRDYVEVMRSLWTDGVSWHRGGFYDLPPSRMYPKPVQDPHPPIYFGGESDAALRRVADLGRGWHGFNLLPDRVSERVVRLEALLGERGRSLSDVDVTVCPYMEPVSPEQLPRYRDAGVDELVLCPFAADPPSLRRMISQMAEDYVGPGAALG